MTYEQALEELRAVQGLAEEKQMHEDLGLAFAAKDYEDAVRQGVEWAQAEPNITGYTVLDARCIRNSFWSVDVEVTWRDPLVELVGRDAS